MKFIVGFVFAFFLISDLQASNFSFGVMGGIEFPFTHRQRLDLGPRVDAFYRLDPYEVRFHYSHQNEDYYGIVLGRKHFFSQEEVRPFVEVAGGLAFVDTSGEGLAYGFHPELSAGAELAINQNFSTIIATRYSVYWYFGETSSGSMEAHHSLNVLAGVTLWF